uniref:Putative secreted protein n=1 Tax=Anopheles darlingi TaxID=43151 RepID=A0A2M4D0L9_ANODA
MAHFCCLGYAHLDQLPLLLLLLLLLLWSRYCCPPVALVRYVLWGFLGLHHLPHTASTAAGKVLLRLAIVPRRTPAAVVAARNLHHHHCRQRLLRSIWQHFGDPNPVTNTVAPYCRPRLGVSRASVPPHTPPCLPLTVPAPAQNRSHYPPPLRGSTCCGCS